MRKQKMMIGVLSMFLSFGAFAQDEADDMYLFSSDLKKASNEELANQPISNDQPSSLSKFSNPDFAGDEEVNVDAYTPTYNYYDENFTEFNNGFQSGFAVRNGWTRGGFYANPYNFYASPLYSRWGRSSLLYCPPASVNSFIWDINVYNPNSAFIGVNVGRSWNVNRRNISLRNFNTSQSYEYCPPAFYGNNSGATQTSTAQNAVRPRSYATRTVTRRTATRSGRNVNGVTRTNGTYSRGSSTYSTGRSSSYSRARSSYSNGRSSNTGSSFRPFYGSSRNAGSRSSYSSGRSSSSRSAASRSRSSSSSRSSGGRRR